MKQSIRTLVCIAALISMQHSFASMMECFVAGTMILMDDGSSKPIESIVPGDIVMSCDVNRNVLEPQTVSRVKSDLHSGKEMDFTIQIVFSDGTVSECTNNHAFFVPGKGYASFMPERTLTEYALTVGQLETGDHAVKAVGTAGTTTVTIVSIKEKHEPVRTYDLIHVVKNFNFFANGILVHNSAPSGETPDPFPDPGTGSDPLPEDDGSDDDDDDDDDDDRNEPSPMEQAESRTASILYSATVVKEQFDGTINAELQKSTLETDACSMEIADAANAAAGPKGGDPVLLTTGTYILEETDFTSPSNSPVLQRTYSSANPVKGSLGYGWYSSLDSRLVRGSDRIQQSVLAYALLAADDLENHFSAISHLPSRFPFSSSIASNVHAVGSLYSSVRQTAKVLQETADSANTLHALNTRTLFPHTPSYYEGTGNNTITLVDESGTPVLFDYVSDGIWIPPESGSAPYLRLVSRDGKNAGSTAGFVLHAKNGTNKHFTGYGLLTAIEDRNGNRTEILRDAGTGRVTGIKDRQGEYAFLHENGLIKQITGPEGLTVRYAYADGLLTGATDADGDTVRYEYSGGLLTKIVKSDNSFIRLEYGYTRPDGTKLTTKTTDEEGAAEKFDYYPEQKLTVHTNHSGLTTRFWYDDSHRTVREEHADGTVKTFLYNPVTDRLDAGTVNGDTTSYTYDNRGNRTSARYSDGSTETWVWNNLDETTQYRDRDGVGTDWIYDEKGNCTAVFSDGMQVFAGIYDEKGQLVSAKTGDRETERYTYDEHGNLATKKSGSGSEEVTETWTSDAIGRVTSYTDGAGRKTGWRYTGRNVTETNFAGLEKTFAYNSRKDLISVIEKDLITQEIRVTKIDYDKRHLPVRVTDGTGRITEYAYREDGKPVSETMGKWTGTYRYDAAGRLSEIVKTMNGSSESRTERYEYGRTPSGETKTVILPLGITSVYRFDAWNRMISVTNTLSEISDRTLSPAGRVETEQTGTGGRFAYAYDGSGRLTGFGKEYEAAVQVTYFADGNLATKTDRNGSTTAYTYDGKGLLVTESSVSGTKTYTYDAAGRITAMVTSTKNPEEPGTGTYSTAWEYASDGRSVTVMEGGLYPVVWHLNAWGEVVRKTDGEGNSFTFVHDKSGRLVSETDGYGKPTTYTWNAIGKLETVTAADGSLETYSYNHLGLVTEITDALGTSWKGSYDAAGRLVRETGRPGSDREYAYDELDRLTTVKAGGEVVDAYTYSDRGRKVTSIDGNGRSYVQEKDAFGVFTGETNRPGDSRIFEYDGEGRSIRTKEFSGKEVITEYDDAKRTLTTKYGDGSETVIVRDATGRITRATGASGTICYRYDEGGKLVSQHDESAGEVSLYTYDRAGRRIRMESGNREVTYRYGKNGELLSVTDNKQQLKVSFVHDVMGRETSRTYGNGVVQETKHDAVGRVVMIRELSVRRELLRAEGYLYDEQGRRSHSVDEKGNLTVYSYDSQSRLETVLYPATPEKTAADKAEAEEAGLFFPGDSGKPERYLVPSEMVSPVRAVIELMSPFRGNMLQSSQSVWKESFTYDANGNRRTKTTPWGTIAYSYDAENRLVSAGGISYTHDRDGNLLGKKSLRKTAVYGYTDSNRMKKSIVIDMYEKTRTTTSYVYDAFGRRTLVQDAGDCTMRTLYDGFSFDAVRNGITFADDVFTSNYAGNRMTASTTDASSSRYRWIDDASTENRYRSVDDEGYATGSARYTGLRTSLFAKGEAVAMNRNEGTVYFGTDLIGSIRSATDAYGDIEARYEYDAFGTPIQDNFTTALNIGYTGKPWDAVTDMYDYGYRDYSPSTARFTTLDPIRDGTNWFVYVNNDPVNWVDPWGLEKIGIMTYNRKQDTITAEVYDDNKGNKPIVKKTYNNVTNIVVTNLVTYDPDDDSKTKNSYNYFPEQFPDSPSEGWKVTRTYESNKSNQGPTISTNASRTVTTYDSSGNPISIVKDIGYADHGGTGTKTWGCLKSADADVRDRIKIIEDVAKSGGETRYFIKSGEKND